VSPWALLSYRVKAKVWLYPGNAAWHFVTLPKGPAREIKGLFAGERRGWGAIPVEATIGATTWTTSIFPDSKSGSYLLPLKASVRKAEGVVAGRTVEVVLRLVP
jgi:hypothetical protein